MHPHPCKFLLLSACLLGLGGQSVAQTEITASPAYRECTTLASTNPAQALAKADEWLKIDSGIAAQHCRAMALYGLRRFAEAGTSLSAIHRTMPLEHFSLRSYIARQAAKAWIGANQADKALVMLSDEIDVLAAIRGQNATIARLTSELLLDRARLNSSYGRLAEANRDLDHAVSLTPINEDVLMERAATFEKMGDVALARSDAEIVLKLNSKHPAAQALMQRLGGNVATTPVNLAAPRSEPSTVTPVAMPEKAARFAPQK